MFFLCSPILQTDDCTCMCNLISTSREFPVNVVASARWNLERYLVPHVGGQTCIVLSPVLDNYVHESFDINRENARVFSSPGFYLRNTTSLRKKETMAMLRINVCMNIIFIVSDIYAHFLIPKITLNSLGHCLKYTFVM